ncbi:LexA family protein [Pseudomonas fulva]|uniref:Phage repressor like transcriptional regulator, XRE family n=1 Tax=Pseudomonas fulva (strain 12-X) TaxID=743720 RepID=F6AFF1_PSEF1|nr:S24 family peptidase [Pseudomonas fulva]AEF21412.1 phage repressor like transcriptional regulator, XRE family [Pseudomonas fulva 12-X]
MAISGKKLGEIFTARREEMNLSESALAKLAGVNQPTTHRILAGASKHPHMENVERLARVLQLDLKALIGGVAEQFGQYSAQVQPGPDMKGKVPVISWVQAGAFCEAIDLYAPGTAEEWLDCPFPHSKSAFCLVLKGLSMFPEYRPDEIILVEPELVPEHNDDVVARTTDGEVTFKRLQITEDGTYLLALNPDFPNRIIQIPPDTDICGVVTGSWIRRRKH